MLKARAPIQHQKAAGLDADGQDTEYDKVLGAGPGADDYIAKPFGMMELMARIRTALRHSGQRGRRQAGPTVGALYVDPGRHVVRMGQDVTLTPKKGFQLLCLLLERRGTNFTRTSCLIPSGDEFDRASRTGVDHLTLRQKSWERQTPASETVRGIGYKVSGIGQGRKD